MKIACYARKSNDKENDSIVNQFSIMENYIAKQTDLSGKEIIRFSDDGFSGINTNRDDFQELLSRIRSREIDCIVVKDLSRLGRNYLDVIKLTDSIFPFMGIRVISISDGYDSKYKSDSEIDLPLAFKAILNEFYVTELSDKQKKSYAHRIRNGALYGKLSFGYFYGEKSNEGRHNRAVLIDEKKAEIVREMFALCLCGKSTLDITRTLNEREISSPGGKQWGISTVSRMLKNTDYIGVKRFFTKVKDLKTKRRTPAKENDVFVNDSAIPPIIDVETFEKVQLLKCQ